MRGAPESTRPPAALRTWRRAVPAAALLALLVASLTAFASPAQPVPDPSTPSTSLDAVPIPDQLGAAPRGPGLYGGTLSRADCNTGGMLAFPRENPAHAAIGKLRNKQPAEQK